MFLKIGKIGPNAWAIFFPKCSNWLKNESSLKRIKNEYRSTFKLFCAINGFKKHLMFEKKKLYKNWQNSSQCMGYSIYKMLKLVQK